MERRFSCTACGKCCSGWLPLTLNDALRHVERFPLFLIWSPVRQGSKAFARTAEIGTTVRIARKKEIAVAITPTAYIPPAVNCPALNPDGLCAVQDEKPMRCKTMPFSPYREENNQGDLLTPRQGWACDTSEAAPVVYRDKIIVSRNDYDREYEELRRQAAILKPYAAWMLAAVPQLTADICKASAKPGGGHVVVGFMTLLPRMPKTDVFDFARRQLPIMEDFAAKTAGVAALTDYHRRYRDCAAELARTVR